METTRPSSSAVRSLIIWLLLLPVLLIPISDTHDWGDDYCQYLDQTVDLVLCDQDKTDVIQGETYAPKHRGEGLSLLLVAPYLIKDSISSYLVFISLSLLLVGGILYRYYAQKIEIFKESLLPILLTLVFIYNYQVLRLKLEILPIFPFIAALYSALYLTGRKDRNLTIFISLITGFAISLANLGFALYISIILYYFHQWLITRSNNQIIKFAYTVFIPIITDQLIKRIVIGYWSYENLSWYENVFFSKGITETILSNLDTYYSSFLYFFDQEVWGWANILIRLGVFVFFPIGFIVQWRKGWKPEDLFFIVYLFILLVYPYQNAGMRFILPIFPLIILYIAQGSITVFEMIKFPSKFLVALFFTFILLSNTINVSNDINSTKSPNIGPQAPDAVECFNYLKEHLKEDEAVAFIKPWALHYYTGRPAVLLNLTSIDHGSFNGVVCNNFKYLLLTTLPDDQAVYSQKLIDQINIDSRFSIIWSNKSFSIFQLKD